MTLADAVARFRSEAGAPSNAYAWYCRSARTCGAELIGRVEIKAWKDGGKWQVDGQQCEDAIIVHRQRRLQIAKASRDLKRGIIHGRDGDDVETLEGGYKIRGSFRLVWTHYDLRTLDHGTWYCNQCNQPAQTTHEKKECHLCSDWNGCRNDCTLSEVSCANCGLKLSL